MALFEAHNHLCTTPKCYLVRKWNILGLPIMLISFVYVVFGQAAATTTAATDNDNDANNGVIVTEHSIGSDRTGIVFF